MKEEPGLQAVRDLAERVVANVGQVLVGKQGELQYALVAVLARGHVLLEDVPGIGKTTLVRALAISLGCDFRRIQFTPDLLPSDITGTSVWKPGEARFEFRPGPVFAQIVLTDEINRASPKTQAALLECMAERQVTADGVTYPLPEPFLVMATQNPVEYEGTFPLPESQLDRFLLRLRLGYPSLEQEREILHRSGEPRLADLGAVTTPAEVRAAQAEVIKVYVDRSVEDYLLRIVQETRRHGDIYLGVSPRGAIALHRSAQCLAALRGRAFVIPDDVLDLAQLVLPHRMVVRPEAQMHRVTAEAILADMIAKLPVPGGVRYARSS